MIGIFDSGFGGLTVLKEILKVLPGYDYLYFGDNARTPYGGHSKETIYKYSVECIDFMFKNNCELIIVACNTASSNALKKIQQKYLLEKYPNSTKRVLGIIRPVVEHIIEHDYKKLGIIGTRATIQSKAYEIELQGLGYDNTIKTKACPLLVPLIEEDWTDRPETMTILKYYINEFKQHQTENMILGCTHYPLLINQIQTILGEKCNIINSGLIAAQSLKDYLKRHPEIENILPKNKKRIYYSTDKSKRIKNLATKFLGQDLEIKSL